MKLSSMLTSLLSAPLIKKLMLHFWFPKGNILMLSKKQTNCAWFKVWKLIVLNSPKSEMSERWEEVW